RALALAHAVSDHLASAELDLFPILGLILLDTDPQCAVSEPYSVAHRGAVHLRVCFATDRCHRSTFRIQRSHDLGVEAVYGSLTRVIDELYLSFLTRLEAHSGTCGDVQTHAPRLFPIEAQSLVRLVKVEVRTHLNWSVASVSHDDVQRSATGVDLDVPLLSDHLT